MHARDLLFSVAVLSAGCTVEIPVARGPDPAAPSSPGADADPDDGEPPEEYDIPIFEEPSRIDALSLSGYEDDDPTVTSDLVEMYFDSNRLGAEGASDIWRSRRKSPDEPWEDPQPVEQLNTQFVESAPEVSGDGLMLWFSSDRPGGLGGYDIYLSTRQTRAGAWSDPVPVPELNSPFRDASPAVDATGGMVVFYSARAGGDNDLFVARRDTPAAPWSEPEYLSALNSDRSEADPHLSADGLSLYFAAGTRMDLDIYFSTRADADAEFGIPQPLADVNTEYHDGDPWVSSDGGYMVIASGRAGDDDLYELRRVAD